MDLTMAPNMAARFKLRIATLNDEIAISELLQVSYSTQMPAAYDAVILDAALPMMSTTNPVILASGTYYVVQTDRDQIVGCGGWTRERPGSGDTVLGLAHVRHIATQPDWAGLGIGRQVYDECVKTACETGIAKFECYASLNGQKFYAALGFDTVEAFEIDMGPSLKFPSILMTAEL
jgi:GNAT superfamily N-acetyltransferase